MNEAGTPETLQGRGKSVLTLPPKNIEIRKCSLGLKAKNEH